MAFLPLYSTYFGGMVFPEFFRPNYPIFRKANLKSAEYNEVFIGQDNGYEMVLFLALF